MLVPDEMEEMVLEVEVSQVVDGRESRENCVVSPVRLSRQYPLAVSLVTPQSPNIRVHVCHLFGLPLASTSQQIMSAALPGSRDLPASRHDLSTYWGRVKHSADISDPR